MLPTHCKPNSETSEERLVGMTENKEICTLQLSCTIKFKKKINETAILSSHHIAQMRVINHKFSHVRVKYSVEKCLENIYTPKNAITYRLEHSMQLKWHIS